MDTTLADRIGSALTGPLTFPAIVERLSQIGVERYHVDYSRQEVTYYLPDGESTVLPSPHPQLPTGDQFASASVEQSVRRSQRGEHSYADFVRETMSAGCVGYFVQIAGRRVQYFGRLGEIHTELFPAQP